MPLYLENRENSGNLKINQKSHGIWKIDQKIREKSGNFKKLIDWQAIDRSSKLYINVKRRMCIIGFRITYLWFFGKFAEIHQLRTLQFAEIHKSFIGLSQDSTIIKIFYCEILKTLHCRFQIFGFSNLIVILSKISTYNIIKLT